MHNITDEFEEKFPGLFENICLVSYGDIDDSRIKASLESTDRLGSQRNGEAEITLTNIQIYVNFEDGISCGSLINWYEITPKDETKEAEQHFDLYEKHSNCPYGDPFAIEIEKVQLNKMVYNKTDIELV